MARKKKTQKSGGSVLQCNSLFGPIPKCGGWDLTESCVLGRLRLYLLAKCWSEPSLPYSKAFSLEADCYSSHKNNNLPAALKLWLCCVKSLLGRDPCVKHNFITFPWLRITTFIFSLFIIHSFVDLGITAECVPNLSWAPLDSRRMSLRYLLKLLDWVGLSLEEPAVWRRETTTKYKKILSSCEADIPSKNKNHK